MTKLPDLKSSPDRSQRKEKTPSQAGRSRLHALKRIERSIAMRHRGAVPPAWRNALLVGVITFGLVGESLAKSGWHISHGIGALTCTVLSALAGFFTYRSHAQKTWVETIYALLADYSPANAAAYRTLQESVAYQGLERVILNDFLEAERATLLRDKSKREDHLVAGRARFLDRRI